MTSGDRLRGLLLALALAACSGAPGAELDLRLERVEPAEGPSGREVVVQIHGANFRPVVRRDLGGGRPAEVDVRFEAWLGDTPLQVTWRDEQTLDAIVPAGLVPGRHALRVAGPLGRTATLEDAWTARGPAALDAVAAVPPLVSTAQRFTASLTVRNTGDSPAWQVSPTLGCESPSVAVRIEPPPLDIPGGEERTYTWSLEAVAPGPVLLKLAVAAVDEGGGAIGAEASASVLVQRAATLSAALETDRRAYSASQPLTLTLTVTNTGEATALGVGPATPAFSGSGAAALDEGPATGSVDLAAGETWAFRWRYAATAVGDLAFTASAEGRDANGASPVSTGTVQSAQARVQAPAALSGALSLSPTVASEGQLVTSTLTLWNLGEAAAAGLELVPVLGGTGQAQLVGGPWPAPGELAGGAKQQFEWRWTATAAGEVTFETAATAVDANSGAPLGSPGGGAMLVVQRPAALSAVASASPSPVTEGQELTLTLEVRNLGGAAAAVTPGAPILAGTGSAVLVSTAPPPDATVAGGGSATFTWTYRATAAGTVEFDVPASGVDVNSSALVATAAAHAAALVLRPLAVEFSLSLAPNPATLGQQLSATLSARNDGEATVTVMPGALVLQGTGGAALVGGPHPATADVASGAHVDFTWALATTRAGALRASASATARDANGGAVLSGSATAPDVAVQAPASLVAALALPASLELGSTFPVTMTVSNAGEAEALEVAPELPVFTGSGRASILGGPVPATATLPGGGSATFTWTATAEALGSVSASAGASGSERNTGAPLSAPAAVSNLATVRPLRLLADDPFHDGTRFAHVFAYRGLVYVGPGRTGRGAVRFAPDGSSPQSVEFSFARDAVGGSSSNRWAGGTAYPSIGFTGCAPDTADCGPDNEDGRGLFTAGTVNGTEWLLIAGGRSGGKLRYVYMTPDAGTTLGMRYVDFGSALGAKTSGVSAAHVFRGRVYLGFPDTGGARPYLLALTTTPGAPGLDTTAGSSAIGLGADAMPGIRRGNTSGTLMIDAITDFNDRLYIANNGGVVRSTTAQPRPYDTAAQDWTEVTPAGWAARPSIAPTRTADLEPADRAVPKMVAFGPRLFLARNTTAGPQLFACDSAVSGPAADCDAADWSPVAPNTTGDASLTQFNDPGNRRVALLAATARHLYIGFDNAGGITLYRTALPGAASAADFTGAGGCPAASPTCQGIGGRGLEAGMVRIFDGVAMNWGVVDYVYLTAGNGTGPVKVFRIVD